MSTPDGKQFVRGKTVTGFTNGEEEEVGLTKVVPFLVKDELMNLNSAEPCRSRHGHGTAGVDPQQIVAEGTGHTVPSIILSPA